MTEQPIGILQQRRIEAGVIKPLVEAFEKELGREKTREILAGVIGELARRKGQELRLIVPDDNMPSFASTWEPWLRDDALEMELIELSDDVYYFNVTRCRYAEMYRELGLEELGYTLSCNRDASLIDGFSDKYELTRTQTIMEGAAYCDFRYQRKPGR
jgi:hypothetical protein